MPLSWPELYAPDAPLIAVAAPSGKLGCWHRFRQTCMWPYNLNALIAVILADILTGGTNGDPSAGNR